MNCRILSFIILLFLGNALIGSSRSLAKGTHVLSPPLKILQGRRLSFMIPADLKIVSQEPFNQWNRVSYDIELGPRNSGDKRRGLSQTHPYIEFLSYDITRATLHGDLEGTPFRTDGGLHGIVNDVTYPQGERDWYLAIPNRAHDSVPIIRTGDLPGKRSKQWAFVRKVYRSVRFLPAGRTRYTKVALDRLICRPRSATHTVIPACARLLNITVGVSTMGELEKYLGPGQPYTGGHPQGARAWRARHQHIYINADGFDYNHRGRIVETITLASNQWLHDVPHRETRRNLNSPELALFGTIRLGMKQSDALHIATQKLGQGKKDKNGKYWYWTTKGFVSDRNDSPYTQWDTTLEFNHGHLVSIDIVCG